MTAWLLGLSAVVLLAGSRASILPISADCRVCSLCADCQRAHTDVFDIRFAWASLLTLVLEETTLTQLPENLSALTSLTHLAVECCESDFQIRAPMNFLTQLKTLREVQLRQNPASAIFSREPQIHAWDDNSSIALMHGRLLLDSRPDCNVELTDT